MINSLIIPCPLQPGTEIECPEEAKEYLAEYLESVSSSIEEECLSASMLMSATYADFILNSKITENWLDIFESQLLDGDSTPVEYTECFGKQLYKFNCWKQTTVHSNYVWWWLSSTLGNDITEKVLDNLTTFKQGSGWFFNKEVSCTNPRTRMKTELLMNLSLTAEIAKASDTQRTLIANLESTASSVPNLGFLGAEYYRAKCLSMENEQFQANDLEALFDACSTPIGFSDFNVTSKKDDYMGTAKRVGRDAAIMSPIINLYAHELSPLVNDETKTKILVGVKSAMRFLEDNPLNLPGYTIRDTGFLFGSGVTPNEVISSIFLLNLQHHGL